MRKTFSAKFIALLIALLMVLSFSACSNNSSSESQDSGSDVQQQEQQDEGVYIEEDEEADVIKVDSDLSQFYGTWTALSEKAQYMYGNVDITVNEDNTWSANITGEKLKGKWSDEGDHIHMANELFSFDIALTANGNVVMIEAMDDGDLVTVLTHK